jgi:hypothetical protein
MSAPTYYPSRSEDFVLQPALLPLPAPLPPEDSPLQTFLRLTVGQGYIYQRLNAEMFGG